jgi:hypothetical protein
LAANSRRQSHLVEALDTIGGQIEVGILDPLLCAASVEQLARTFERVFSSDGLWPPSVTILFAITKRACRGLYRSSTFTPDIPISH